MNRAGQYAAGRRIVMGWRGLLAGLLVICGAGSCATLIDDSRDFSEAEREQFTEAPRLLKSWAVGVNGSGDFAWYDDRHLVIDIPFEVPARSQLPQIALVDVYTGKVERTKHRGRYICYADGNLVLGGEGQDKWHGRLGGELENRPGAKPELVPASCLEPWYADKAGQRVAGSRDPRAFYKVFPLRRGDGVLRQRLSEIERGRNFVFVANQWQREHPGQELPKFESELVSEQGEVRVLRTSPAIQEIGFDEYQKKYFSRGNFFAPSGELGRWDPRNSLSLDIRGAAGFVVRTGVVWAATSEPVFWRKQGVYFRRGGSLYRLDKAWPYRNAGASPNGCLVAYKRSEGNPWIDAGSNPTRHPETIELRVMDVCQGGKP